MHKKFRVGKADFLEFLLSEILISENFGVWDLRFLKTCFGVWILSYWICCVVRWQVSQRILGWPPPATTSITWRWWRQQNPRSNWSSILPHASSLFPADDSKTSEAKIKRSPEYWLLGLKNSSNLDNFSRNHSDSQWSLRIFWLGKKTRNQACSWVIPTSKGRNQG